MRRWFVLTPGTHVEAAMRNTLYAKLQDLPVAFHDRWQSGQLLSRSMSDLGSSAGGWRSASCCSS